MKLSRIHYPITSLGPGMRVGIWFQGCSIRCAGCISADTWTSSGPDIDVDTVLAQVAPHAPMADGVTVSGGEPFDQPTALLTLLQGLRTRLRPGADILVYSGYPLPRLQRHLDDAHGLIDALISDPFDLDTPQTLALRGSDNQRLHGLTPLGRQRYAAYDRPRAAADDCLDVMIDDRATAWMAGIPRRHDLERLRAFLASQGAEASTSEHRTSPGPGRRP